MNSFPKLLWLAVSAFAIGTESYVIAGLLPSLAADLHVSVPIAGQLITVFSLAYAIGSPLLAVATAKMERRRLLLGSLASFALFNVVAAFAHSYTALLLARVGLALSAGTFMPAASAYAVAITPAARRGRALAIIYTGLTVATVVGVPVGVMVGERLGWRSTFVGVAALATTALFGLVAVLQRQSSGATIPLRERIAIARRPDIAAALVVTVVVLTGAFTLYAYLAPFLEQTCGLRGDAIAAVLFLFGVGSAVGNLMSGSAADRLGPRRVISAVLLTLSVLFTAVSLAALFLQPATAKWVIIPTLGLWGFVGWSFPAAQQARIVAMEPKLAPLTLSLNASAIYFGVSLGAFLGSLVVAHRAVHAIGFVAAACELIALALLRLSPRRRRSVAPEGDAAETIAPAFGEPAH